MSNVILICLALINFINVETNHSDQAIVAKTNDPEIPFPTVQINGQLWMAANLTISHFNNGDPIPHATNREEWISAGEAGLPAWTYYDFNPENGALYGKLYNWYVVEDPRGIAPPGWRVPNFFDFAILGLSFGGPEQAAKHLKSREGWRNNGNGTNKSGFNGLPAGSIGWNGDSLFLGISAFWWSTTQVSEGLSYHLQLMSRTDAFFYDRLNGTKANGFSIRLIKVDENSPGDIF